MLLTCVVSWHNVRWIGDDPNHLHTQLLSPLQQVPAILERTAKCHAHLIVLAGCLC